MHFDTNTQGKIVVKDFHNKIPESSDIPVSRASFTRPKGTLLERTRMALQCLEIQPQKTKPLSSRDRNVRYFLAQNTLRETGVRIT